MLKAYAAQQNKRAEEQAVNNPTLPESLSKYPKYPMIQASMPITADGAKAVIRILKAVSANGKATHLKFPGGLQHGAKIVASDLKKKEMGNTVGRVTVDAKPQGWKSGLPSLGLELSAGKKDELRIRFHYRPVSGSLRLPEHQRAQGDLGLRLANAQVGQIEAKTAQTVSTANANDSSPSDMEVVIEGGVKELVSGGETPNLLGYETTPIDDVAWQDFSEYLYV